MNCMCINIWSLTLEYNFIERFYSKLAWGLSHMFSSQELMYGLHNDSIGCHYVWSSHVRISCAWLYENIALEYNLVAWFYDLHDNYIGCHYTWK